MKHGVAILGVFVADTVYQATRLPKIGETIIGSGFSIGPGGKGSNQASLQRWQVPKPRSSRNWPRCLWRHCTENL